MESGQEFADDRLIFFAPHHAPKKINATEMPIKARNSSTQGRHGSGWMRPSRKKLTMGTRRKPKVAAFTTGIEGWRTHMPIVAPKTNAIRHHGRQYEIDPA
jgi:hypothetical protein